MGMTMTQKILAKHAGLASVEAGQLIEADLDLVLGNDVTTPVAIHEMEKFNKKEVFDKSKIALVMDHFTPNKDIKAAEQCRQVRNFADKYDIEYLSKFYETLNKKNTVDAPLLKIGAGSGLMATSIAMKLKEYDPTSFDRVRKSFKRSYEFEFPKSRKVTKQGKPFGWVKLEFN